MYTQQQRQTVLNYANWLAETKWDICSTITYRYDVKEKQNYKIMTNLERYLKTLDKPLKLFWVTEFTNYNYNTHNHLLHQGGITRDIEYYLRSQSLIGKHVKHEPYREEASMYVSKYVCDTKTNWGIIENNS
tara:strand:+ start:2491 stop:2886 length:396 start_codon:yes stop_codon:yes gene_type:complete